jgi:hypothetical protein
MWIESHIELGEHPKVYELCHRLEIRKPEAVGLLHLLWHFVMKFAWRDGDLRRFTPTMLVRALDWRGDAEGLISALQQSGWLDNDMKVHDWLDYAGKVVKDRLYNELRRKTPSNHVIARKTTATNKQTNQQTKKEIKRKNPYPFQGAAFEIPSDLLESRKEIEDWLEYKRQRGQRYKGSKGLEALWRSIRKIPTNERRAAVDHSMANNWSGLFEPKQNGAFPAIKPANKEIVL